LSKSGTPPHPPTVIKEKKLYSTALLLGIAVLFAGLAFHLWELLAVGALVAGAGGWFGMLATLKKS
jgi:hypothetical protein